MFLRPCFWHMPPSFSLYLLGRGTYYSLSSWLWLLHGHLSAPQGPKPRRAEEDGWRLPQKAQKT